MADGELVMDECARKRRWMLLCSFLTCSFFIKIRLGGRSVFEGCYGIVGVSSEPSSFPTCNRRNFMLWFTCVSLCCTISVCLFLSLCDPANLPLQHHLCEPSWISQITNWDRRISLERKSSLDRVFFFDSSSISILLTSERPLRSRNRPD